MSTSLTFKGSSAKMQALVTGGSGFVGSAVVRALLENGCGVRVLMRRSSVHDNLRGLAVELVEGDLRERATLERALEGAHCLFHVAADYRQWVPRPEEMYATNVEGTRELMEAARKAGVERVVYTSSTAVLGLAGGGRPADETTPSSLKDMVGHYRRSKFLAEELVRCMVRDRGLAAVIVNPSATVGPRDIRPTPTGRMVLDAAAGRMPAYVDTSINVVHVDDVAAGHVLALRHGRVGERYILGGTNMMLKEVLETVAQIRGARAPRLRLSPGMLLPIACVAEMWARTRGTEPRITVDALRISRRPMRFSSQKACSELGYAPRSGVEALRDAVAWFQSTGYL